MGIKLSISNIAWPAEKDQQVYCYMQKAGFQGLEIAPTRLFPEQPYEKKEEAKAFARDLKKQYGLSVCSMQSIWYGHSEKLFGTDEERQILLDYTKKAIDFAEAVGAGNLVFGCPRNRVISEGDDRGRAVDFFRILGDYAYEHGTVLAMEANPTIYGTNFINKTKEAIELMKEVGSKGFKLNFDFGTLLYNEEDMDEVLQDIALMNHVHISEPNLKLIEHREAHKTFIKELWAGGYEGFVSIEMGRREGLDEVFRTIDYVAALRGKISGEKQTCH